MPTYYAVPCPEGLRANFDRLVDNFERGVTAPQNQLLITVANEYTDKIIEVMILGNSQMLDPDSRAAKVLSNVAAVVKTTAHTMIRQVLHKMKNEEMAPLTRQIRSRKLVIGDNEFISFLVPDALAQRYRRCFADIRRGDLAARSPFMECMLEFSGLANHYFYVESLRPLKLGLITRKIADMGGVTIHKASQAAIRKLIPQLDIDELQGFVDYIEPFFVDAD